MASFVILLIARTARIACSDRHTYIHTYIHTYRQTDRQTHETTTVTLSAHARRGLIIHCYIFVLCFNPLVFFINLLSSLMHLVIKIINNNIIIIIAVVEYTSRGAKEEKKKNH